MKTIKLFINAKRTMEIVEEIKQQGMIQGTDFDFEYHPSKYDADHDLYITIAMANFIFYTEKYATFFALKYSQ